jgi:hypothetical protein
VIEICRAVRVHAVTPSDRQANAPIDVVAEMLVDVYNRLA